MMKHEFETLIDQSLDQEEYAEVEFYYVNSTNIHDVGGKEEISQLYKLVGLEGIKALNVPLREEIVAQYDAQIALLQKEIEKIETKNLLV